MSALSATPIRRAGSLAAAITLAALTLIACSPDATRDPLAPSVSTLAADTRGVAAPAQKYQQALPFKGTLSASETHDHVGASSVLIHVVGMGTATHLGRFTLESEILADDATLAGEESMTLTAANGDILTTTGTVEATPSEDSPTLTVVSTMTITGGTGRFADATGSFILQRVLNFQPGFPSTGSFTGSIMR